jgi:hypothetical protein
MKAKRIFLQVIIILFLVLLALLSVSNTYAYWVKTSSFQGIVSTEIQSGKWFFSREYKTGFEDYTLNTYGTYTNQDIDGVIWDLSQVISANSRDDSFFESRGLRFKNNAYIVTKDSFFGLESLSFNFGDVRGGFLGIGTSDFDVEISNDGSNFTTIYSGSASSSFPVISIDVESIITDGFTLDNGSIVDMNSNLFVRISFSGWGLFQDRLVNMDNLVVNYRSLIN